MRKKTVLTLFFLTFLTSFYGFNHNSATSSAPSGESEEHYAISPYDHLMRSVSEVYGNDWRLMSAIAYHESRFTPDIVSKRGARGLMQIMPAVARQFDVRSLDDLFDPETNVAIANKVLNTIESSLRLPAGIREADRMSLALASYNGGIGHVKDARHLARAAGENPNSWEVVSRYLTLKSQPEYYEADGVKCGKFTGAGETSAFVDDVMRRYDRYCAMTE